jgi:hypothetical protein
MPETKAAAKYDAPKIGDAFESVIQQVRQAYSTSDKSGMSIQAVDIELNFKSVAIAEDGWVLFGKDTKESHMEIRLATRITPGAAEK